MWIDGADSHLRRLPQDQTTVVQAEGAEKHTGQNLAWRPGRVGCHVQQIAAAAGSDLPCDRPIE